jgi:hypothetical protein
LDEEVSVEREIGNNYYSKILPLWKMVSIDDFLRYGNCDSFFHWDCPDSSNKFDQHIPCLHIVGDGHKGALTMGEITLPKELTRNHEIIPQTGRNPKNE